MTRRRLVSIGASALATLGCSRSSPRAAASIQSMAATENLGILGAGNFVLDTTGKILGEVQVPGGALLSLVVSPDGELVAWYPRNPVDSSFGNLLREVVVSDGKLGVKRFSFSGQGGALAISQGASTVVAVVYDGRLRLMTFETASGRETDISHLLENIDPRTIQHLCTSLQGDRLLVGAESDLCVLDLAGKRSMFRRGGRYPSITPDGQRVAFVEDGVVVIYEFKSNQFEKMPSAWQVDWLGAWSPNGKFLLAAGRKPFSFRYRVFAIDIEQQDFAEVMDEPDEVLPGLSWVNRRFATKLGPPRPL